MKLQEIFENQIQLQVSDWEKQIKELRAKSEEVDAQARSTLEKGLKELDDKMGQAVNMLDQVRQVNEAAWRDMEGSTTRAFEELKRGWQEAAARYK